MGHPDIDRKREISVGYQQLGPENPEQSKEKKKVKIYFPTAI